MSQENPTLIYLKDDDDPAMQRAYEQARKTFRFFWRELSWEYRRIIPGLDLACVKIPFADPPQARDPEAPECEQMWINDIQFDGQFITGTLINSPNWLATVQEGDQAKVPVSGISDWMYAIGGRVYGGFTVNLMRATMSRGERAGHDSAWGLDFGDPNEIELVPADFLGGGVEGGFFNRLFGGGKKLPTLDVETTEHPMSVNMGESLREFLQSEPGNAQQTDEKGWTMLHQQALAGSATGVEILLEQGADPNAVTDHGMTPLQLAESLGWTKVARLLTAAGGS